MVEALYSKDDVGMTGPVTNYISGQQQIPVGYKDSKDIEPFAKAHSESNKGVVEEVRRLVGFCLLVRRSLLEDIGSFDERYGLGNYEDDDLCLRAIRNGYKLLIARGAFIHHIGHASMGQPASASLGQLLEENRDKALQKWGSPIHTLIYAPAVRISACFVTRNNEDKLADTLASLEGIAEEIIVLDDSSTDRTVDIAKQYTNHVISVRSGSTPQLRAEIMYQLASGAYLLWLEPEDKLDSISRRRLQGIKHSLVPEYDVVSIPLGKMRRYLTAKQLHHVAPKDIEEAPRTAYFRWDSFTTES
jgi:hypothetical protein